MTMQTSIADRRPHARTRTRPVTGTGPQVGEVWLDFRGVCALLGRKESAVKAIVRRPDFPDPSQLSGKTRLWPESEVQAWLHAQRAPLRERIQPASPSARATADTSRLVWS